MKRNNETYVSHLKFAATVGLTLMFRGGIFILHGFFPICSMPKKINLEDTYKKLDKWNDHAEQRTAKKDM